MTISPLQAATDVLARAKNLLTHAATVSDPLLAEDVLRAALAQSVAALDTYLHWALADTPLDNMPSALKRSEAMVQNRDKIRPKVRARGILERETRRQTFQSSRGAEEAMLLLGIRRAFNKIASEIRPHQSAQDVQDRLNRIVNRRNQVVHEGDLQRQSRPQRVKRGTLDPAGLQADLDWIEKPIFTIDRVVS